MSAPLLEVRDLAKSFEAGGGLLGRRSGARLQAVRGVSFDLEGEVATPAEEVTPVRRACGHFRPQPARPIILAARGITSSLPVQQLGAGQHCVGKAGCAGERLVELHEGAVDVAAAHPQHAVAIVLLGAPGLQVDDCGCGPPPNWIVMPLWVAACRMSTLLNFV